jgi:hypothetical protein
MFRHPEPIFARVESTFFSKGGSFKPTSDFWSEIWQSNKEKMGAKRRWGA